MFNFFQCAASALTYIDQPALKPQGLSISLCFCHELNLGMFLLLDDDRRFKLPMLL